ncbi:hypothetical protein [Sphingomonas bacterium]|uniref:hypothetical protein n=1 Tax=Sphingomonas bacterium TaxID=1895847 RepID=UPI001575131A|nr:hypothetical protein [Sphingomonas bacterium]
MIAALLLAVAPATVTEAERAFAADAKAIGQWAAYRKWAAPDATMFVPEPVKAQNWLKDRADPAAAIEWWPTAAWVSCDGTVAVDTGGWKRQDGGVGYFTTVWRREPDGRWRWIVSHGDHAAAPRPRPASPPIRRAMCGARLDQQIEHLPPGLPVPLEHAGKGALGVSDDGSLAWYWGAGWKGGRWVQVTLTAPLDFRHPPDSSTGSVHFWAEGYKAWPLCVIDDHVDAPQ